MTLKGGVKILYTILGKTINFDKCNSYRQIAEIIYNDPSKYFTTVKNNKLCCRKCGEEKSLVSIYNKIKYHREIDDNWYCKKCANEVYKPGTLTNQNNNFYFQSKCKYESIKNQYKKNKNKKAIFYLSNFSKSNYIKFGVTIDINGREKLSKGLNKYNLINIEKLVTGNSNDIIELEYDIKLKFAIRNKDGSIRKSLPSATETYSKKDIDEIKKYIKKLKILF